MLKSYHHQFYSFQRFCLGIARKESVSENDTDLESRIALVGENGSGEITLVKLLTRRSASYRQLLECTQKDSSLHAASCRSTRDGHITRADPVQASRVKRGRVASGSFGNKASGDLVLRLIAFLSGRRDNWHLH